MNTFLQSKEININPTDFELDFKKVLGFRHRIFHGNFVEDGQELSDVNSNMPKFAAKFIRLITNQKDEFDLELEEKNCLKLNKKRKL